MPLARLILVADDYALSPGVSAAIRELAELGRLSATGAMTAITHWPEEAAKLRPLHRQIAVGLHFTLTDQRPAGPMPGLAPEGKLPPIGALIRRSMTGNLPFAEIAAEYERQLDLFERHFGAPPDFIDGHQHVHVLAGIWPIVQGAFGSRLDREKCWLRNCWDPAFVFRSGAVKAGIVGTLARTAAKAARAGNLRVNRGFTGFYDYGAGDLAHFLPRLLAKGRDGMAMMVHPGHVDQALRQVDSLVEPREAEYRVLAAADFHDRLAALGFRVDGGGEIGQTAAP